MSSLVGNALPQFILYEDDERLYDRWVTELLRLYVYPISIPSGFSFVNMFWPRQAAFLGDMSVDYSTIEAIWRHLPPFVQGASSRYGVVGVTRDQYGSPVGGVTVKLFRTVDDLKVDQQTSDPLGNFMVNTPYYPDQHYLVTYKSGSPDIFGASVNTLTGS